MVYSLPFCASYEDELYRRSRQVIPLSLIVSKCVHVSSVGATAPHIVTSVDATAPHIVSSVDATAPHIVSSVDATAPHIVPSVDATAPHIVSSVDATAPHIVSSVDATAPHIVSSVDATAPHIVSSVDATAPHIVSSVDATAPHIVSSVDHHLSCVGINLPHPHCPSTRRGRTAQTPATGTHRLERERHYFGIPNLAQHGEHRTGHRIYYLASSSRVLLLSMCHTLRHWLYTVI